MKKQPQFSWDEETGTALCLLETRDACYVGTATCAAADQDMKSEKTGCEIAYHRALINFLKHQREELRHELNGLKKYYYSINQSKNFNPKEYQTKMLRRQIQMREDDILDITDEIREHQIFLQDYFIKKAEFYKKIREGRNK